MEVRVRHRDDLGRERLVSAAVLRGTPVEEWPVLNEQRPYKGRKSKVSRWWSSTTKKDILCRSKEHAFAAMFLDRDPDIAYLGAASLQLEYGVGEGKVVVEPAFLARTVGGQRVFYFYSPAWREPDEQEWAVARAAADDAGWEVRAAYAPAGQLRRNVYIVSQFRHDEYPDEAAKGALLEVFARPRSAGEGADAAGLPPGQGRARCWHLLWTGALTCDWERPLTPDSMVWAVQEAR
ncbi:hypothetical protein [Streptomyces cathayae]|uniref:Uncharacterized protein n=1 Tax=Streptomyces cathayae TaxID=3031124 RepID=A0ABY8JWP6_9ACTN|nr:hypothetical protein [Streptomyces sp. HUAS 5]WGD38713.1 hypothetical protein PYS65_00130 [Streptomyces sp. HUAS 5]WGD44733.1 hypothetical protein PYS65_33985 [Streptomyces sp. HUAS 5]WGD45224.1 hypothetical protein PYS65_34635 [Streptomyces sp. HUAS 5]